MPVHTLIYKQITRIDGIFNVDFGILFEYNITGFIGCVLLRKICWLTRKITHISAGYLQIANNVIRFVSSICVYRVLYRLANIFTVVKANNHFFRGLRKQNVEKAFFLFVILYKASEKLLVK